VCRLCQLGNLLCNHSTAGIGQEVALVGTALFCLKKNIYHI
jgi:hypothetical protein